MAVLPARIGNAEARISEAEETARTTAIEALEDRRITNNRLEELESHRISVAHSIDDINASLSRQNKEIEENHKRFSQLLLEIENRVDERFNEDRASIDKKIEHVTWQMNKEDDKLAEKLRGLEEEMGEQRKTYRLLYSSDDNFTIKIFRSPNKICRRDEGKSCQAY